MTKLSDYEIKALNELQSAMRDGREPKDIVNDCRQSVIRLQQHFCLFDCKVKEDSLEFKSPWRYLTDRDTSFFFGNKPEATESYDNSKRQIYIDIFYRIKRIQLTRNDQNYDMSESDDDMAKESLYTLKNLSKLYFGKLRKYELEEIQNVPEECREILNSLLPTQSRTRRSKVNVHKDSEEFIMEAIVRQRPKYYVLVLVDASSSMIWPYLDDIANVQNPKSEDYALAVKCVQASIKNAHIKALTALRGSSICQQGYLKVCQYIFNHEIQILNAPAILDRNGMDDVKNLSSENYYPDGMTALYDTIEQSTRLITEKYIFPSKDRKEIDKLILVVITDGEDTIIGKTEKYAVGSDNKWYEQEAYLRFKDEKVKRIRHNFRRLRGQETSGQKHLESAIIIGLTNAQFSDDTLQELQKELGFNDSISIEQSDGQALRRAFRLFSSNAINN